MKRPLAVAGSVYLAAQLISVLCGLAVSVTLFAVCALLFALSFVIPTERKETLRAVLLCAAVSFSVFSAYELVKIRPARSLEGCTAGISGRLIEQPGYSEGRYYYFIDTFSVTPEGISLKGVPQKTRVRLSSPVSLGAGADDVISCRATFNRTDGAAFSSAAVRLRARGVTATGYIGNGGFFTAEPGKRTVYGRLARLRTRIEKRVYALFGRDCASLLCGMLLGDRSGMDAGLVRNFRRAGISHYLAVSGLHLSLYSALIEKTLLILRLGLKKRSAVMPVSILFFMALTGFSASVTRAGIMYILYYAARALSRESDSLNSLGASVLIMCFLYPYAAADAGMLMSVSATFGLITAAPVLNKKAAARILPRLPEKLRGAARAVISAAAASFTASASVFPASALYFGEVSLLSVPCNICCLYPAYCFMLLGALAALMSAVPFIGRYLGLIAGLPVKASGWALIKLAGFFASPSRAVLNVNYRCLPAAFLAAAAVAALAICLYRGGDKKTLRRAAAFGTAVSLALSFICVCAESAVSVSTAEICVFDAGDGVACFARKGGGGTVFCAGCDPYKLYLMSERLDRMKLGNLDAVVLMDDGSDGFLCAESIAELYRPERVYLPESIIHLSDTERLCGETGCAAVPFGSGGIRYVAERDAVSFELITDIQGLTWCWINAGGVTALIAPDGGDCTRLTGKLRSPDIVIIRSERVTGLTGLRAKAVLISAEGDAAARTEALLRYRGTENVFAAPEEGAVRITRNNDGIKAEELN